MLLSFTPIKVPYDKPGEALSMLNGWLYKHLWQDFLLFHFRGIDG
jgi:hypothetical protein